MKTEFVCSRSGNDEKSFTKSVHGAGIESLESVWKKLAADEDNLDVLIVSGIDALSTDIQNMNLESPEHGGCGIRACSIVLAARCEYFANFLTRFWCTIVSDDERQFLEKQKIIRYIMRKPNIHPMIMNAIIVYCHTNRVLVNGNTAFPLLEAADELQLEELTRLVAQYVRKNLSPKNAFVFLSKISEFCCFLLEDLSEELVLFLKTHIVEFLDILIVHGIACENKPARKVLQNDFLYENIHEEYIWQNLLQWAATEWSRKPDSTVQHILNSIIIENGMLRMCELEPTFIAREIEPLGVVNQKNLIQAYRCTSMARAGMHSELTRKCDIWNRMIRSETGMRMEIESAHPHQMDASPENPQRYDIKMPPWATGMFVSIDRRLDLSPGAQLGFFSSEITRRSKSKSKSKMVLHEVISSDSHSDFRMNRKTSKCFLLNKKHITLLFVSYKAEADTPDLPTPQMDPDHCHWGFKLQFYPVIL